jgi:hypothetical protein
MSRPLVVPARQEATCRLPFVVQGSSWRADATPIITSPRASGQKAGRQRAKISATNPIGSETLARMK